MGEIAIVVIGVGDRVSDGAVLSQGCGLEAIAIVIGVSSDAFNRVGAGFAVTVRPSSSVTERRCPALLSAYSKLERTVSSIASFQAQVISSDT